MVAHRYCGEAARLQTRQRHESAAVGCRINLGIVAHIGPEAVPVHARRAMLSIEADVVERRAVSRPHDIAGGLRDGVWQFSHAGEVAHPNGEKLGARLVCAPCQQPVIGRMCGSAKSEESLADRERVAVDQDLASSAAARLAAYRWMLAAIAVASEVRECTI